MSETIDCDYFFKILLIGSCTEDKSKILLNILDNICDEDKYVTTNGDDFVRITK